MTIPREANIHGRERLNDMGQTEIYAYATVALTAKTMYKLDYGTYGPQVVAIADDTDIFAVCIPERAVAQYASDWVVIRGPVEDAIVPNGTYTTNHAFKLSNGTITSMGATWAGNGYEVGAFTETHAANTTTSNIYLAGGTVQNQHA
jgi:hypothetical protein